jgi:hypothetical protein
MSSGRDVTYALDFAVGGRDQREPKIGSQDRQSPDWEATEPAIPRIARLMALAIRFEGLLRKGTIRDLAELARLGGVTRARMTQIIQLLDLAPDIQEQILFLPPIKRLNERNLRTVVGRLDWHEQRLMFQKMLEPLHATSENPNKVVSGSSPGESEGGQREAFPHQQNHNPALLRQDKGRLVRSAGEQC